MPDTDPESRAEGSPPGSRRAALRARAWRLATPAAFLASGALLVTSAVNADGADLRPAGETDLGDLAQRETARVEELRAEVARLNREIDELSDQVNAASLIGLQDTIDALEVASGMTPVAGPGLTVVLEDAPERVRDSAGDQVSNAIVHQQDIQAVANALWAGGAEAMTLQGQRVISTTGIKCVGNTVLLHGVTYSPPYVISAIGDLDRMRSSLETDASVRAYRDAVDQWQLGWELREEDRLEAPAYAGPTDLRFASAAGEGVAEGD